MADNHRPDKDVMCHRTGFTKSCFECVITHGCRLWKPMRIQDPEKQGAIIDKFGCLDEQMETYFKNLLRLQERTAAEVHEVRNDMAKENAGAMVGIIGHLNERVREQKLSEIEQQGPHKLIEAKVN